MGVSRFLLRVATDRPHVLLVEVPGGTRVRLAVEQELRRLGWPAAAGPADTDVLVVTGPLGPRLRPLAERVWQQIPAPRACLHLLEPDTVPAALNQARRRLAGGGEPLPAVSNQVLDTEHGSGHHGTAHESQAHQHDMPGGEHDMHMGMVGGLSMADRGPDRDGLMLDQLHVPLGPLLPDWPAGLVVHTTLQGDVIQDARAEVLCADGPLDDFWGEPWRRAAAGEPVTAGDAARRRVAAPLDSLARLLTVVGWPDAAVRTRRLRDDVLGGASTGQLVLRAGQLTRRLRTSRTLHWLTDGVGVLPGGDATARWLDWLADIELALAALDATGPIPGRRELAETSAALAGLLEGAELGTARLIVASLDPDVAGLAAAATVTGG